VALLGQINCRNKHIGHTYGFRYVDGSGTQDQKFVPGAMSIDLQHLLCLVPTSMLPVLL